MSPAEQTTDLRAESLAQAKEDLRRLMVYAAGQHDIEMKPELIDDVVVALRAPPEIGADEEKRMWQALDGLTRLVRPVTAQSLRLIEQLECDASTRPGFWRRWRDDTPARKIVQWARRWAYGTLVIVVVLQIYALAGSRLIDEFDRIDGATRDLANQKAELVDAKGAQHLSDAIDRHLEELDGKRETIGEMLRNWVLAVNWLRPRVPEWVTSHLPEAWHSSTIPASSALGDAPQRKLVDRVLQGRMILQAFALHILPVLYGLLGASAYILRRIADEFSTSTFAATSIFRYRIRQGLGVVLGLAVGVLPWNVGAVDTNISVSSVALAFIAGYNVDAVFSVLDGWMEWLKSRSGVPSGSAAESTRRA